MTVRGALVLVSLFISVSASVAAADDPQASSPVAGERREEPTLFAQHPDRKPYLKLFKGSRVPVVEQRATRPNEAARTPQPKVVCGMVLIPADPDIDPGMRVSPPQTDDTRYTIRAVKPPMCNPE